MPKKTAGEQDTQETTASGETSKAVEVWSALLRLPSWQVASLMKMQGWKTGKTVTEEELQKALAELKTRRMGKI